MILYVLRWLAVLVLAFFAGKLMTKIKMPSILGWLIVGMIFGPHAFGLMPQAVMDAQWYKVIIMWMQGAFGLMLGTELIWKKLKKYGKALVITTLTQSLGTFVIVSLVFGVVFAFADIPLYLAFVFGGIALATAPAPALSIVNEFHAKGPVTDTLLPHSGVSLVFTGIICGVLSPAAPQLAQIVQGTIAAAAVINEIIAVIAAKKGFELAGEIKQQ